MDIIFAPLSPEKTAKMFRNAAFFQGFSTQMYQHYTSFTDYAGCYKNLNILTLCIDPKHIHGNAPTLATKVTKYPIANFQPQFLRLAKIRGKKGLSTSAALAWAVVWTCFPVSLGSFK